jgi:hypothetical protein
MAYDVAVGGEGRLSYATPAARRIAVIVQAVLWFLTLAATSHFASVRRWRLRRRRRAADDQPLIHLGSGPSDAAAPRQAAGAGAPR